MRCKVTVDTSHYPKEGPWELPDGWAWLSGNDIFHPMESAAPKGDFFDYIDIDAIDNSRNLIKEPKHIPVNNAPSRASRKVSRGDVLFSMVRPYLRNIALVEQENCIASTGFYVCHCSGVVDNKYCFYLMLSDYVVDGLNQFMKGDNSPSINNAHVTSWLYPIPPLAEQKRINKAIENILIYTDYLNDAQVFIGNKINDIKARVLDLAIHGKLAPQDPKEEPGIELLKRINPDFKPSHNLHYKDCPIGWQVVTLKEIVSLYSGRDLEAARCNAEHRGIPYLVGASCIENQNISIYRWTENPEVVAKINDTLLSCKGTVGEVVLNQLGDVHIARQFMAIRSKSPQLILPKYIELIIKASIEGLRNSARGIIPGISREDILEMIVAIPPLSEQNRILTRISELENSVSFISLSICE